MRASSFKLPEPLDQLITELAAKRKITRSAFLREALEAYTAEPARSVTSLASDLVGSLEGPRDLSRSDRHVADYGR